jgi:hypothetical protein
MPELRENVATGGSCFSPISMIATMFFRCRELNNFVLVKQGMRLKIVPTERLEWPPPYKAATEKYASSKAE